MFTLRSKSWVSWKVRSFIVSSVQYIWIWIHCCTALLLTAPTGPFPIPSDITQPGQGSWLWSKHLALKLIFALFNGQYVCVVCQAGIVLATWLQRLMAGRRRRLSLNEIYTCREAGQLSSSVVDSSTKFHPRHLHHLNPRPSSPLPTTSINAQQTATIISVEYD